MSDTAYLNIGVDSTDSDKAAKSLDNLADYAEKAEKATGALGQAAQKNAKEYKNLSDMAEDLAQSERKAIEQIHERTRAYTKTASAEVAAMQAAQKSANAMGKYAEETEKLRNSLNKLLSDIDPLEGKLNKLDDAEQKLTETFRRGIIDAEKYAESLAKIGAQRDQIAESQLKDIGDGAEYAAGMMEKLGLGTRQAQTDLMNLGRGAVRGNLTQVQNSLFSLTRSSGALSSALVGVGAVAGVAVGSMALLGTAYYQGYQRTQEFNKSVAFTGNALSTSAGEMARMTDEVGRLTGSYSQAEQAVNLIVRSGRIASDSIQDVMQTAVEMQQTFGQSVDETISEFERLGDSPSKTLLELNEKYRFLTAAVYEQVRALEDQGRMEEATKLAQIETSRALGDRTTEVLENVGTMERAWRALRGVVVGTFEAMANVGKRDTLDEELDKLNGKLQSSQKFLDGLEEKGAHPRALSRAKENVEAAKELVAIKEEEKRNLEAINALEGKIAEHQQEQIDQTKFRENYIKSHTKPTLATDLAKANEELKKVTAGLDKESAEYAKVMEAHYSRIKEIEKRHKPKGGGANNQWAAEVARLKARIAEETSLAKALENTVEKVSRLNEFERKAMQLREQASKETKVVAKHRLEELAALNEQAGALVRNNKLTEEAAKERLKYLDGIEKSTKSTYDEAQKLRDQAQTMGMSRVALEQLTTARLQEQIAQLRNKEGSEEEIKLLEGLLAARENLTEAVGAHEMARVAQEAQREMEQDWKRTVDEYGKVFRDGFAGMINDGKDGWKSFTKSLATTFKTSVADQIYKLFAQPFIAKVAVSMAGGLGMGGAANAMGSNSFAQMASQMGGGASQFGMAGGMSWLTNFGGNVSNTLADFGANLVMNNEAFSGIGESLLKNAESIGQFADMAGDILGYGNAIYSMTKGNYGAGIGAAAGQYFGGPIGSFVGSKLGGMLDKSFKGETRSGGGFGYNVGQDSAFFGGGPSGGYGGQQTLNTMTQVLKGQADLIQSVLTGAGIDATVSHVAGAFESSDKGRGGTFSGGELVIDNSTVKFGTQNKGDGYGDKSGSVEEMFANMEKDLAYSALEAFQIVGDQMPSIIQRSLRDMDIRALTPEQAQSAVGEIQAIVTNVNLLMGALDNLPFTGLKDLSFDLAASLLEAAGGMDVLIGGIGSYYQGFFSEQERFEMHAKQLETAISELGLDLPNTKQGFRGLMEALDATDEANHETIAGLFKLSDAAGTYYDYLEQREAQRAEEMGSFREAFYSDAELHASLIDDLRSSLQDLGHDLPDTRRGFRDLVDALDATDESNHTAIDSLLGMSDVADKVYTEIERQADEAMRKAQESSQSMARAAQEIVASFEKVTSSIHSSLASFSERIQLDIMKDDEERYAYHKQTFDDLARQLSQANDMSEIQDLVNKMTGSASSAYNLLDEDVRKGGKGQEYLDTINRIQQEADQRLEVARDKAVKDKERELKVIGEAIAKEVVRIMSGAGDSMKEAAGDISGAAQEFSYAIGNLNLSRYSEVNS